MDRHEEIYRKYVNPPQPLWEQVSEVLSIIVFIFILSFGMVS